MGVEEERSMVLCEGRLCAHSTSHGLPLHSGVRGARALRGGRSGVMMFGAFLLTMYGLQIL
jgi:hypothetical protein